MGKPETWYDAALQSVLSCLISELVKTGHLDLGKLIENIQGTAAGNRAEGRHQLADNMHNISEYLLQTIPLS
jgi:hypothetical protein